MQPGGREPPDADGTALVVAEPALHLDAKPVGQDDVVADFGVEIERNVSGIQGDIVLDEAGEPAIAPPRDRHVAVPEEAVVHQKERSGGSSIDGRLRGVHRRHDAGDRPPVLHLEPVDGVPLVRHLADPKELVGIGDHVRQRDRGHGASACIEGGLGAATSVPAARLSAAACTRERRVSWISASRAGFGS
jgi:hypothetical protein